MGKGSMQGFVNYVARNGLVQERYAKFYGMWVERCLAFRRTRPELSDSSARLEYLAGLREDPQVRDWQYRQADDSTNVYVSNE